MATAWGDVKRTIGIRLNKSTLDPTFVQMLAEEAVNTLDGYFPSEQTDVTITTEPGQYFYLLGRGITKITMVRLLLGSVWIPLDWAKSYEEILLSDPVQPGFTAIPSKARAYGRLLRLFPTPAGQYPLEISSDRRADVPTDDNDTLSFWVDEGRELIINAVCKKYCLEVIHNPEWAQMYDAQLQKAEDAQLEITTTRNGPHISRVYV